MPAKVILTVTDGAMPQREYVFDGRTTCLVGRDDDCHVRVPNSQDFQTISRHHCLLDVNPPEVRVRDLGSKFGTRVNGEVIGQRQAEQQRGQASPERDLKEGDEIRLGSPTAGRTIAFRVGVQVPVVCACCGVEIPSAQVPPGGPTRAICPTCQLGVGGTGSTVKPVGTRRCVRCNKELPGAAANLRQGELLCDPCRSDPREIVRRLLARAETGEKALASLHGYQIERDLGVGGMGAVCLAGTRETGHQLAIKVMLPQVAADEDGVRRFLREAYLTRALRHRNVVRLRDTGRDGGVFFFTMDFCDRGTVMNLCDKGPVGVDEALNVILQVLAGLEFAHASSFQLRLPDGSTAQARGMVHRDLKPSNIFLQNDGAARVARIGDYGLAKAFDLAGLSGLTLTGSKAGTPHFMPRQQMLNFKESQPEVDVWAAAACLYYVLTGYVPRDFPQGDPNPWLVVMNTQAVPIRDRKPSIPRSLADVIDKALIDQPEIHYKTAIGLRRALERAL